MREIKVKVLGEEIKTTSSPSAEVLFTKVGEKVTE